MPVAVDLWPLERGKDAEAEFYRRVANQGPRRMPQNTQGLYTFGADGVLLGFTHRAHESGGRPRAVKELLEKTLAGFRPTDAAPAPATGKEDATRKPPEGGLVLDVSSKVLGGYREPRDDREKIFQGSLGLDHLWVRKDEAEALARGSLPASLTRRLARFNLIDNTRGEPPLWEAEEVRSLALELKDGRLSGSATLRTDAADRGAEVDLLGTIEVRDGRIVRFDLVARGVFWGLAGPDGTDAPEGRYPVAIAFRLAAGDDESSRVPPQGRRAWDYLR